MNDDLKTVLVVDDDPLTRLLAGKALNAAYRVVEAVDGESAIALAKQEHPDLVVMDIRMPVLDGYEACRRLKADDEFGAIPVIFLSGEVELADRLAAYDAGGEDFINKPPAPDELRAKIALALKNAEERQRLASDAQQAFSVAMTAMSSASELGLAVSASRALFAANDLPSFAKAMLEACSEFGLEGCLQLKMDGEMYRQSHNGRVTPVQAGALEKLAEGDRIFSLGRQASFNFGGVTLLIRNMPKDDPDRLGRLRDHLAVIAEVCEGRLLTLASDRIAKARQQALGEMFQQAVAALDNIHTQYESNKEQTETTLNLMLSEIDAIFPSLGLTQRQEAVVSQMLRDAATRISELYASGLGIASHISTLKLSMDKAA